MRTSAHKGINMALVSGGFFLTVTLQDSGLNTTTKEWELRGADIAAATTNAASFLTSLNAVTDANVVRYSISSRFYENAPSTPSSGQIEELAIVAVRTSGGNGATIEIPSPVAALFLDTTGANSNVVDTTATVLGDYYAEFLASGGTVFISDGESATQLVDGQRGTKKSRQRSRR